MPRPPVPILLALVAAVLFRLFFVGVDLGSEGRRGSVLWVALGDSVPCHRWGRCAQGQRDLGI
jgi:hypothetical protein